MRGDRNPTPLTVARQPRTGRQAAEALLGCVAPPRANRPRWGAVALPIARHSADVAGGASSGRSERVPRSTCRTSRSHMISGVAIRALPSASQKSIWAPAHRSQAPTCRRGAPSPRRPGQDCPPRLSAAAPPPLRAAAAARHKRCRWRRSSTCRAPQPPGAPRVGSPAAPT
eukprot:scaffold11245_cov90-Phaeocystis_antarctica.AAC.5